MNVSELLRSNPSADTLQLWLTRVPYAVYLGIQAELHGSEILFTLPPDEKLIGNPTLPAIHGGVVGAFMSQAATFHLIARMDEPVVPKVIDFSLDYLRPTRMQPTYARCDVTRQGRFIANVSINAWQEQSDQPCATARAHFLIVDEEGQTA